MKQVSVFLLFILISGYALCTEIDSIKTESKITDVTVFFSGAQITRHASLKLNKGKHMLIMEKLPRDISSNSIQVNNIANCKILFVKHTSDKQNENIKSKEEQAIETKIKREELKIKEIKNKINVFDLEEKLLIDNSNLGKDEKGSSISEIKEAADFYRLRLNEIRTGKLKLNTEFDSVNTVIQKLYIKLNETTAKKRITYSNIIITVECEKQISSELIVSYYINSAGWEPLYDFRVDDVDKPLSIVYNANVYQTSGEDWKDVNIKLSTNNPELSGDKPELSNWYLGYNQPSYKNQPVKGGAGALTGKVLDESANEKLPFVNVTVNNIDGTTVSGTLTDSEGNYTIKPVKAGYYNIKARYTGYNTTLINNVKIQDGNITFLDIRLKPALQSLQEVVVESYQVPLIEQDGGSSGGSSENPGIRGQRSEGQLTYIDGTKVKGSAFNENFDYISHTLKTDITNLEYIIEVPYSIPSDGEDYNIKIKEESMPVNYVYYAVPKLDNDVFLTAEIPDWSRLNLLSGKSSIYYQGTFTGESYIDVNQLSDTINISLGRDRNIIVQREGNKEVNDKQIIGNNIKETIGWNISVKNNKNVKVNIVVEDQYPISTINSINSELIEANDAKVNSKTGLLLWKFELTPNEKKVLQYKYSVKYPKYVKVMTE